jgi:hypothetical protein
MKPVRSAHFLFVALLGLAMSVSSLMAQSVAAVDSVLQTANKLYDNGNYVGAELEARRAIEFAMGNDTVRMEFERIIAFSLVAQEKENSAIEHFIQVLTIDKNYTLDPALTSPKILDVFEHAKRSFAATQRIQSEQSTPIVMNEIPSVTYRSILFPGWEQLHQGRETKGCALLGAGILSAGLTMYFDVQRRENRNEYHAATTPERAAATYDNYNRSYKAEIYSACAFALVYLYAEVDAFVFVPKGTTIHVMDQTLSQSMVVSLSIPIR